MRQSLKVISLLLGLLCLPMVVDAQQTKSKSKSSEDEYENLENFQPRDEFKVDWVNLYRVGLHESLALGALPGCR